MLMYLSDEADTFYLTDVVLQDESEGYQRGYLHALSGDLIKASKDSWETGQSSVHPIAKEGILK